MPLSIEASYPNGCEAYTSCTRSLMIVAPIAPRQNDGETEDRSVEAGHGEPMRHAGASLVDSACGGVWAAIKFDPRPDPRVARHRGPKQKRPRASRGLFNT